MAASEREDLLPYRGVQNFHKFSIQSDYSYLKSLPMNILEVLCKASAELSIKD